jgi:hypothetical protein
MHADDIPVTVACLNIDKTNKITYACSENYSPHWIKIFFGAGSHTFPPPQTSGKISGDQEGCRPGLKPVPDESW